MYRILDFSRLGYLDGDFESPAAAYAELERDADERKAELLQKLQIKVDQGFKDIENQLMKRNGDRKQ